MCTGTVVRYEQTVRDERPGPAHQRGGVVVVLLAHHPVPSDSCPPRHTMVLLRVQGLGFTLNLRKEGINV